MSSVRSSHLKEEEKEIIIGQVQRRGRGRRQLSGAFCGFEKRNRSGCRADDKITLWTSAKKSNPQIIIGNYIHWPKSTILWCLIKRLIPVDVVHALPDYVEFRVMGDSPATGALRRQRLGYGVVVTKDLQFMMNLM